MIQINITIIIHLLLLYDIINFIILFYMEKVNIIINHLLLLYLINKYYNLFSIIIWNKSFC